MRRYSRNIVQWKKQDKKHENDPLETTDIQTERKKRDKQK